MGQSFRDESGEPQVSRTCAQWSARTIAEGFSGRKTRKRTPLGVRISISTRRQTRDDSFSSPLPEPGRQVGLRAHTTASAQALTLDTACGIPVARCIPRYRFTGEGSRRTALEQAGGVGGCKCQCYSKHWGAAEHTPHQPPIPPGWCGWPPGQARHTNPPPKTVGGLA